MALQYILWRSIEIDGVCKYTAERRDEVPGSRCFLTPKKDVPASLWRRHVSQVVEVRGHVRNDEGRGTVAPRKLVRERAEGGNVCWWLEGEGGGTSGTGRLACGTPGWQCPRGSPTR